MIKGLFWVGVGAIAALQSEKILAAFRARFTPRAVTDGFLDRINSRLESRQSGDAPAPGL
jgi:hypothetical protein